MAVGHSDTAAFDGDPVGADSGGFFPGDKVSHGLAAFDGWPTKKDNRVIVAYLHIGKKGIRPNFAALTQPEWNFTSRWTRSRLRPAPLPDVAVAGVLTIEDAWPGPSGTDGLAPPTPTGPLDSVVLLTRATLDHSTSFTPLHSRWLSPSCQSLCRLKDRRVPVLVPLVLSLPLLDILEAV